jgi:tetratricopeptide (TPR) repeat protein
MYYISRIAGTAVLAALGVAVWFSVVLGRADFYFRKAEPAGVQRAVEIAPRNTEYLALRALEMEYDGGDATALNERIAALNPYSSAPRIRLGLAAEIAGRPEEAERWLLEAARVDHQFEPRWTLANFYFREGNREDDFWKWMRAALEVSYGDRTPAYDLCWRVSGDAGEILRRAIPDVHEVTGSYLIYLSQTNRLAAMAAVARRLAAYRDGNDLPMLFGACDQLLQAKDAAALEVWAMTGQRAPGGIFNGDFESAPLHHGFDWRAVEAAGVTQIDLNAPAGHRIVLSGQEAESAGLLQQTLSLGAGKRYRVQWEARTTGIKAPSGIEWRAGGQSVAVAPSEDWKQGELAFDARERFEILMLAYQRPLGESRAEGSIELRHVRVSEVAR